MAQTTLIRLILLQLGAFWSVWLWYIGRAGNDPEALWGLLALTTALFFSTGQTRKYKQTQWGLFWPILWMLLYLLVSLYFPGFPLLHAGFAMLSVVSTLSLWRFGKPWHLGLFGLVFLALPVIPSLQFYFGYPLRWVVASGASGLLTLSGLPVWQDGVYLHLAHYAVAIDAPCSGIKMLWASSYLACALICFYRLNTRQSLLLLGLSLVLLLLGNMLRASSLFYLETGLMPAFFPWLHEGVGVIVFILMALLLFWYGEKHTGSRLAEDLTP
ncbi:archaeosortase/exosortase family protein [Candidatus Venteria ishoeyi]|nr:archaeosortase/exosortase family protein [Candidatus Venteria ishoeyi]